jgi:spermidine synthase
VAVAAAAGGVAAWRWAPRAGLAAGEVVLEEAKSKYNHVVVTERGVVRTMYFVVDGTYYIESRVNRGHEGSLDLDYTRTMMAGFLVQPTVKRFLMIGFGGGQITNYLFRRFPGIEIDGVDIDGEVIRLARKYFEVPDSPRYRTHAADGRLFIEQAGDQKWDMVLLDAFRGVFVPFHLKTVEFYEGILAHLTGAGVVAANLHSQTGMYKHDRNTLATVFPTQYAFHSENGRQTAFVASASDEQLGVYDLRANAEVLQDKFDFDLQGLAARWYLSTDWETSAKVLRDDFPPGDTPDGAERHNTRCQGEDCPYRTK